MPWQPVPGKEVIDAVRRLEMPNEGLSPPPKEYAGNAYAMIMPHTRQGDTMNLWWLRDANGAPRHAGLDFRDRALMNAEKRMHRQMAQDGY